ncbi:MAG: tRNA pseudouridine(55) synthase TruB [Holosporales bacterium]|nr:tRNA pseudouridine(55) synthase TruB [Holosporales bacterium]
MEKELGGIIIVDKPENKTSQFIDRLCKKLKGVKKAGHLGTLDPFATGVLAIAINFGTKAIPYIKTSFKKYEFEIKFGEKTNTADKTGTIIETSPITPSIDEIQAVIPKFIGKISQIPPAFSALKINGKRAYDIARSGKTPIIKERTIDIYDLRLLAQTGERTFKFVVECSPGTYIRTLSENIADALKTVGHAFSLRRTLDGMFAIENAISVDDLNKNCDNIEDVMIPLENVLDDIPVILVSCHDAFSFSQGRCIKRQDFNISPGECLASSEDGFLGIVLVSDRDVCPKKIFKIGKENKDVDNCSRKD